MGGRDATLRGRAAEEAAALALASAGYRVVETNYRVVGAEIDLVCRDDEGLVFVEVRARRTSAAASDSITPTKLTTLLRGARTWLARHGQLQAPWRLVVVAVTLDPEGRPVATEILDDPFLHVPEFHHGDP